MFNHKMLICRFVLCLALAVASLGSKVAGADEPDAPNIPLMGDEVSLTRIKANPRNYVGRVFVVCGTVKTSNYYNWSYVESANTHYSFDFGQITSRSKNDVDHSESSHVYLDRRIGAYFAERAIRAQESEKYRPIVRLRCTIYPARFVDNEEGALDLLEILDWQYLDMKTSKWSPWASQIARGLTGKKKSQPEPKTVSPEERAASLLRSAQNLEKAKKASAALEFYRQIVKDFSETPSATQAAERIKAIEGK